jgi:hypothetical protein
MQHKSDFGRDDTGISQLRITAGRTSRYRNVVALCLAGIFLGFGLLACSVPSSCGSTSLNSACTVPSQPTIVDPPAKTASQRSSPTATPTVRPTATPTVSPTLPVLTDKEQVTRHVGHYNELVLRKDFNKAYNLLDVSVRDKVSYDAFINNASYVLNNQCWQEGKPIVSQRANQTWDVSIPMMQVSCADGTVQATFSWHFTVWMIDNLPEIMSVGLYPTGTGT